MNAPTKSFVFYTSVPLVELTGHARFLERKAVYEDALAGVSYSFEEARSKQDTAAIGVATSRETTPAPSRRTGGCPGRRGEDDGVGDRLAPVELVTRLGRLRQDPWGFGVDGLVRPADELPELCERLVDPAAVELLDHLALGTHALMRLDGERERRHRQRLVVDDPAAETARDVTLRMFQLAGSTAIYDDHPLQRRLQCQRRTASRGAVMHDDRLLGRVHRHFTERAGLHFLFGHQPAAAEALGVADHLVQKYLGVTNIFWLGHGIAGDDTHGHVDDLCRFVDPRTVVLIREKNAKDINYRPLEENWERIGDLRLEDGSKPEVVALPMPSPLVFDGRRLPASYAYFYVANAAVLVPTFNDPMDRVALGILGELFRDRPVVGIHAVDLVWGLGTLHCLSQQEPRLPVG